MRNLFWFGVVFTAIAVTSVAVVQIFKRSYQNSDGSDYLPLTEERRRMIYYAADRDFV